MELLAAVIVLGHEGLTISCQSVQVKNDKGEWVQVVVPDSVKAIVLLNLQSYAGGRDLWGLKDMAKDREKGWKVPIFNDGLIEVSFLLWPDQDGSQKNASCMIEILYSRPGSDSKLAFHNAIYRLLA